MISNYKQNPCWTKANSELKLNEIEILSIEKNLHSKAFVRGVFGCAAVAVGIDGCVIAAKAAKLCMFIGGRSPAAAAAAVVSADCVFNPKLANSIYEMCSQMQMCSRPFSHSFH